MKSGLTVGIVAAVSLSVVGANAEAPPFAANRRYDPGHSFRGLSQNNLSVDNYEVSGHAYVSTDCSRDLNDMLSRSLDPARPSLVYMTTSGSLA